MVLVTPNPPPRAEIFDLHCHPALKYFIRKGDHFYTSHKTLKGECGYLDPFGIYYDFPGAHASGVKVIMNFHYVPENGFRKSKLIALVNDIAHADIVEDENRIPCRTEVVINHASWMHDHLASLGSRRLSHLVLPASHDAAMYRSRFIGIGKTQCLPIYEQLACGIRWFDIRVKWTGDKFVTHHSFIQGPDFSAVLNDIQRFAQEQQGELIVLKLSHFSGIDDKAYSQLASDIATSLGGWLVKKPPQGKRLGEMTLAEYVQKGPAILVLVDEDYAINNPVSGICVYRDWDSDCPGCGDLCVFDQFSNTVRLNEMIPNQTQKFEDFNGRCKRGNIDCDLFLLSWTLTPTVTTVWSASQPANRVLANSLAQLPLTNYHGKIVNLIYVDYVEFSGVVDAAIRQNQRIRE